MNECRGAVEVDRGVEIEVVETLSSSFGAKENPNNDYARII